MISDRIWIERHGNRIAHTIVGKDIVYYDVCEMIADEAVTIWSATVPFGRDKAHRAAGPAFSNAASMQETYLKQQMDS